MARRVWTDEQDSVIRRLHADGASPLQIATELGEPNNTGRMAVLKRASTLGITWEHRSRENDQTAAGRAAREAAFRARSARLRENLLVESERMLRELRDPVTVYNFGGKDNTFETADLPEPSHADKLKIAQTVSTLTTTIEKLDKLNADAGTAEAAGALDRIAAAILAGAEALRGKPVADPDEVAEAEGLL